MGTISARLATAFLSLALIAGLSGCGGSDPVPAATLPRTPAPVPETTEPTAEPTEEETVETVRPEIDIPEPEKYPPMANDDINGASTAARYFLDLYGYAYMTGNLATWNKISDKNCEICDLVSVDVESEYAQGRWFENFALLHGKSVVYYPSERAPYYLVVLDVQFTAYEVYDKAGILIKHEDESHYPRYALGVRYVGPDEWILVNADSRERSE